MTLHEATKKEYRIIKKLYLSAFPPNERAPFLLIWKKAMRKRATLLVADKDSEFSGFAYTVCHDDLVYLFYFAVPEDRRGCGIGGEILRMLKETYRDKMIFLAREPLDDNADNRQQRIDRRNFYIRNGFMDLPYQIREAGVIYDLMGTGPLHKPEGYNSLIREWAGPLMTRIVKMEIRNK